MQKVLISKEKYPTVFVIFLSLLLIALAFSLDRIWLLFSYITQSWYQAGVFVAITLGIVYFSEKFFKFNIASWLKPKGRYSLVIAALMGAFPGCGGSIVIVLSFMRGQTTLGALVASLTATMGDAAFLLLGRSPVVGVGTILIEIIAGIAMGYVVNTIHGSDFLRPKKNLVPEISDDDFCNIKEKEEDKTLSSKVTNIGLAIWAIFVFITFVLAILLASDVLEYNPQALIGYLGFFGGILMILWWLKSPAEGVELAHASNHKLTYSKITFRIFEESSFVTAWVAISYIVFGGITEVSGLDISSLFKNIAVAMPLIAIVVGFIPSCGPQIIVTSLYLNKFIGYSALLGNAISSDGDALIPALRLAPKATLVATLYSALPAVILSYLWFWLFE